MRHRSLKHEAGITTIMGCVFHDMMLGVFANLPFCSVKKSKNMYATTDIIVNRVINLCCLQLANGLGYILYKYENIIIYKRL